MGDGVSLQQRLALVRNVGLVGLAIAILVCFVSGYLQRDVLLGAWELNEAQTRLQTRLPQDVGPGAVLAVENVTDRSGALVVGVGTEPLTAEAAPALQDAVWTAYVTEFGPRGFGISHVAVTHVGPEGTPAAEPRFLVDVATLAERTGKAAPALHPLYAESDVFDPATEEPPALEGDDR